MYRLPFGAAGFCIVKSLACVARCACLRLCVCVCVCEWVFMTAQSICPCSVSLSSSSSSGRRSHSQSWRPIGIGENVSIIMCIHTFLVSLYVCMCVFLCAWIVACLSLCVCLRLCVRFLALLRTYEWCARYNVVIDTFWYQITWNYNKQHGTQTYTYRTTHTHTHTDVSLLLQCLSQLKAGDNNSNKNRL